jgi:hypothetical protein
MVELQVTGSLTQQSGERRLSRLERRIAQIEEKFFSLICGRVVKMVQMPARKSMLKPSTPSTESA